MDCAVYATSIRHMTVNILTRKIVSEMTIMCRLGPYYSYTYTCKHKGARLMTLPD